MKKVNNLFTEEEWDDIVAEANDMIQGHPYLRLGQCLYNIAYPLKPDVVGRVAGTSADPFHGVYDINHERIQTFKSEIVQSK